MKEHFLEPGRTAYDVLGIKIPSPDRDERDIKRDINRAYAAIIESIESVSKGDKDVSTGDVAKELRITVDKAYLILIDQEKREKYNAELFNSLTSPRTTPSSPEPLTRQTSLDAQRAAQLLQGARRRPASRAVQRAPNRSKSTRDDDVVVLQYDSQAPSVPNKKPGFFSRIKHAITGRKL